MIYYIPFAFLTFLIISSSSQVIRGTLASFELKMERLKKAQGRVIAIWASFNIVAGGILAYTSEIEQSYFHLMNTCWGIINASLAAFLYFHHNEIFEVPQSILKQLNHQRHAENMLMFNIGLDIAFMALGVAIIQYEGLLLSGYPGLWSGFGHSFLLQGFFLFTQDTIFFRLHVLNRRSATPGWQKMIEKQEPPI